MRSRKLNVISSMVSREYWIGNFQEILGPEKANFANAFIFLQYALVCKFFSALAYFINIKRISFNFFMIYDI